ncbi:restriction endonuclease subunit S [Streptomyces sp. NPDC005897]|uniref:restriction endonuclease subunit S n=1 Tax=Streptomyces sp. NPDC005897 TaxID=3157081 RepID=UPI0033CE0E94
MSAPKLTPLGQVAVFQSGGTPDRKRDDYYSGSIPWVTGADIDAGGEVSPRHMISERAVSESGTGTAVAGDLLLVTRTSVGKAAIARGTTCFSQDITGVRVNSDVLVDRYLFHYIRSQERYFTDRARGATIKGVTREVVRELGVPIFSLARQRRIAQVLDHVDSLRDQRRRSIALLEELVQAIFLDMFGNPVTNPKGLATQSLGSFGRVVTGNTPSRAEVKNYGDAIEWIKSDNINSSCVGLTPAAEGLSSEGIKKGRVVPAGSLLVTCIAGSPASIGNVAMADRSVAFNQQINSLTPLEADPIFLYFQLRLAKPLVLAKSTGGMKGLVSKSKFESVVLLNPPLVDQRAFASRAQKIIDLRTSERAHLADLDSLFAALQHYAFKGELWAEEMAIASRTTPSPPVPDSERSPA